MRKVVLVILAILIVALHFGATNVHAQTTSISTLPSLLPVLVNSNEVIELSVSYSGGRNLIIGIIDVSTEDYVKGVGSALLPTRNCKDPSTACMRVVTSTDSGTITVSFEVVAPMLAGDWKLKAIASIADDNYNSIQSSKSESPLPTIRVYDKANLIILLPPLISVQVDGVEQEPGNIALNLSPHKHSILVPQILPMNDTTRFRFIGWGDSDCKGRRSCRDSCTSPSNSPNRTVDTSALPPGETSWWLWARYVIQYKVTVTSPLSYEVIVGSSPFSLVPKEDWYDESTVLFLSVPASPQSMNNILGALGAKWIFDGWYTNVRYLANSSTVPFFVRTPIAVEARWRPDYTTPIRIAQPILIVLGALVLVYLILRRTRVRGGEQQDRVLGVRQFSFEP